MKKIVLFDPSMGDNNGSFSSNLGDIIINDSVMQFLKSDLNDYEVVRISTHVPIHSKERSLIKGSELIFVGGTNLLSSDIKVYNQWKSNYYNFLINFPIVNNAILFGVGWWQYQNSPTKYTRTFYKKLLSSNFNHSVRDSYAKNKVEELGISNCINTSCPTTWSLNGMVSDRKKQDINNVLLMLTDYHPNAEIDNKLINILLEKFSDKIFFFPQGKGDIDYIKSLKSYNENRNRFVLLNHDINDLNELIKSNSDFVYIGTRLHGGVRCLQNGISGLILSNDNRSKELGNDINLAVINRDDFSKIVDWIEFKSDFGRISLPQKNIENWKLQFVNK
ncbi:polysaccharide pyruvyl transferase family protein [Flavobacterium psychrotolerans]|uniref:Polysaccharide pyruvyl transferase family protein n=1 Tax=Flavobacterium psychrotolerans TaxID=2169410 RepID=A0A2U1JG01_9FLAO|nr:polysaccharide pyruvyl transferase family protein [Flavobacterium psychrotolerans]PWA04037.1 polysaccharide pyruvyl transferase family protein [Flavobacterium psychrotolerans]